jgi:hypothetical protein
MAVYVSNVVIEQGFDFTTTFELEDTITRLPLILAGYGVTSHLRKNYNSTSSVIFDSEILESSSGTIRLSLDSEKTANLKPGRYVYDILLQEGGLGSGLPKVKALEGMALVRGGVTR